MTAPPARPPAGPAAVPPVRLTLGAITTTTACVVPVFLVGGLAVQMGAELEFSPAGLGLAVAIYFGVSALTSVPAGALVERYGAAATARAGIAWSALCLLAVAVAARTFPALVVLLAASAVANGLGQLASNAVLTGVPRHRQGLSFGIKQAAIPAATLLAGASVPALALTVGWRWAFVAAAVAAALALPLVPHNSRPARNPDGSGAGTPGGHAGARPDPGGHAGGEPGRGRSSALRQLGGAAPALVVVGVAVALGTTAASALGTFLVDSTVARGVGPATAGLTLTLGSIVCAASRIGGGALVDRRNRPGDLGLVALYMAGGAVGLGLLAVPGPAALALGVLLGFGFGWAFPGLVNVAVVQLHPHAPAAATSITQTGVYAGGAVGPLAFGALAAGYGYPTAWLAAGAALLIAAGLVLAGRRLLGTRQP